MPQSFSDEGVKLYWDKFVDGIKSNLASSNAQTPEEVAEVIKTVIDAEKPNLRYQTGPASNQVGAFVRVDPTGNASVQAQVARFFKD